MIINVYVTLLILMEIIYNKIILNEILVDITMWINQIQDNNVKQYE